MKRIILLCLLLLTACSKEEINVSFTISPISDEEFSKVGGIDQPNQEDFKMLDFELNVELPNGTVSSEKVRFDNLRETLNTIDGTERYWYGSGWEYELNMKRQIVIYTKGVSNEQLTKAFEETEIHIVWMEDEKQHTRTYNLAEILEIQ
ncbi:hypothetical protein AAGS61_10210 [Lysinibacillus sp. KU-BSD001]|uniref:hypothetical protein n=1 Tax=Lysinibacillus sp. KU-BSD001 TaxID=3141328 RepID=UPI0036EE1AD3